MIVSTHQPYFAPYPGFFYKIMRSDICVLLDSVQFPQGTTWVSRNRFKNDQGTLWLTIPVWKKGLGLQKINEIRIYHEGRWAKKHLESLRSAYAKAPYLPDHLDFLKGLFERGLEKLINFNLELIRYLLQELDIETHLVLLSDLKITSSGTRLPVDICSALGSKHFLALNPSRNYLDEGLFSEVGIDIEYTQPPSPVYPQLWGKFLANLSILDLLFNCGPKTRDIVLAG